TRSPVRAPERLLLVVGMAGFLISGLAIPAGFGRDAIALGLGYLLVVLVHAVLYARVNKQILRIAPFNLASALLVIGAGFSDGILTYLLWGAALVIQALSPFVVRLGGRFEVGPEHFAERHGALIIVAIGESVAAIGIGALRSRSPPNWYSRPCSGWRSRLRSGGPTSAAMTTAAANERCGLPRLPGARVWPSLAISTRTRRCCSVSSSSPRASPRRSATAWRPVCRRRWCSASAPRPSSAARRCSGPRCRPVRSRCGSRQRCSRSRPSRSVPWSRSRRKSAC